MAGVEFPQNPVAEACQAFWRFEKPLAPLAPWCAGVRIFATFDGTGIGFGGIDASMLMGNELPAEIVQVEFAD